MQPKTILASLTEPTERTLYVYIPPTVHAGETAKSFVLQKGRVGFMAHLPVSRCTVEPEQPGYVEITVPEWLVLTKKQFFQD
ncbi:hypothetical protein [Pontibacter beigongshangensis]|uniref:hypothetical protein n=1 Tax=Pontibacter beigongshangensis TaxID=2574733 RepID=UPI0016509103|nr:hypothetical protein [Pontibacter beigongshangensis]